MNSQLPTTTTTNSRAVMEKIHILGELVDNRNAVANMTLNKMKQPHYHHRNHRSSRHRQRHRNRNQRTCDFDHARIPAEIWNKIFSYCQQDTLEQLKMTCTAFRNIIEANSNLDKIANDNNGPRLSNMPSELILGIFSFLNPSDLANCAKVCKRFRDLTTADCLWMNRAKAALATNVEHPDMKSRSINLWSLSVQDRVRISQNWVRGSYSESQLIVQDIRYMPRVQLDR